ncbi:hypothetical protein [Streptomyces sp. NPDC020489]
MTFFVSEVGAKVIVLAPMLRLVPVVVRTVAPPAPPVVLRGKAKNP